MDEKVFVQDTENRVPVNGQMLKAQLLFREQPKDIDAKKLGEELGKLVGNVEYTPGAYGMVIFSCMDHIISLSEDQDVPAQASFGFPKEFSANSIDDMKKGQFWDYEDGASKIHDFKWCIDISGMLGGLPYKEQTELFLAQVDAALKCYPECEAVYVDHSGKLTTPKDFEDSKKYDLSIRFIRSAVNTRFFKVNGTENDMIVDTLGMFAFGGADVQIYFRGMDGNNVMDYAYNIAKYQFDNEFSIKNGDMLDSLDSDGKMRSEPQWNVKYTESLVQPIRVVLDIDCGEFAAGT